MEKPFPPDTIGTSFHGDTIYATVNDIIKVCGEPDYRNSDLEEKSQCEWMLQSYEGFPFTIYDWKEYRHFHDDEMIEWHIGAHESEHSRIIHEQLTKAIEDKQNEKPSIEKVIAEAQLIMEGFDPTPAMTLEYDQPTYSLTSDQMTKIARALYLADCEIHDLKRKNVCIK
jgi:hypothetical protein